MNERNSTLATMISTLAICGAALAGGGSTGGGGDPPPPPPPPVGDPIQVCGTLFLTPFLGAICASIETHNGEIYLLGETGGFEHGDAICVDGLLLDEAQCDTFCEVAALEAFQGCIFDAKITPDTPLSLSFTGWGMIDADGGCTNFAADTGETFLLDASGTQYQPDTGDYIYVSGTIQDEACAEGCDPNDGCLVADEIDLAGDVDGDGSVGFADLLSLLSNWGPCAECPADLDASGSVDFADLLIVLSNWG